MCTTGSGLQRKSMKHRHPGDCNWQTFQTTRCLQHCFQALCHLFSDVLGMSCQQAQLQMFMSLLNFDARSFTGARLFSCCSQVGTVQLVLFSWYVPDGNFGVRDQTPLIRFWKTSLPRRNAEIRRTNSGVTDLGRLVWADTPSTYFLRFAHRTTNYICN